MAIHVETRPVPHSVNPKSYPRDPRPLLCSIRVIRVIRVCSFFNPRHPRNPRPLLHSIHVIRVIRVCSFFRSASLRAIRVRSFVRSASSA